MKLKTVLIVDTEKSVKGIVQKLEEKFKET
jgi:hypothetical protein